MLIKTLSYKNVQVSGAKRQQKPEILREKVVLNLCLQLTLTLTFQILWNTNFLKQKFNSKNFNSSSEQCIFSLEDVRIVF